MERICGIYCIKNLVNGKVYIGQSVDIKSRWRNHKYELRNNKHDNEHLQNSWNSYGEENFVWSILEKCSIDLLDELETYYIRKYQSNNSFYGYNHESGGHENKELSEDQKNKIRLAHIGIPLTEEHKQKISEGNIGRVVSDSTKQIISQKLTGITRSEETCEKISLSRMGEKNWNYGKPRSDKTKQKIKESNSIKVYCIELNQTFNSLDVAAQTINSTKGNICGCCRGKRKSAGKHPTTGAPLHWLYLDDAINQGYTIQNYS